MDEKKLGREEGHVKWGLAYLNLTIFSSSKVELYRQIRAEES
jgi:hypothetical protein